LEKKMKKWKKLQFFFNFLLTKLKKLILSLSPLP